LAEGGPLPSPPPAQQKLSKNQLKKLAKNKGKVKKEKPQWNQPKKEKKIKAAPKQEKFVNLTPKGEKKDLSKIPMADGYHPSAVEAAWQDWWEAKGFYSCDPSFAEKKPSDEKFVMVIPPPNVTGKLLIQSVCSSLTHILLRISPSGSCVDCSCRGYADALAPDEGPFYSLCTR